MKAKLIGSVLAGVMMIGAGVAFAQNATLTIAPADQTKVMTWIKSQNKSSMAAPAGFSLTVGATLPSSVMLYPIDPSVGVAAVTSYNYAIIDNKTVLVDPSSHKVVEILG